MIFDRWSPWAAWGSTVLRVIVGFIFVMYGWDKFFGFGLDFWAELFASQGIPWPNLTAALVGIVELVGGMAIVLGLFTRVAAALLSIDMAVAMLVVGIEGGFFVWDNGISFPLALFAATLALLLMGAGEASLDEIVGRRKVTSI